MKLGLILECPSQGTDHLVYEYIIKKLRQNIEVDVVGLNNKKNLIVQCGNIAKLLFDVDHCNQVVILWDLIPRWKNEKACRKDDVDAIRKNLEAAKVDQSKIKLNCIEPELEGWIIAEGSALTKYKEKICQRPVRKFHGRKVSSKFQDSKKIITKYLGKTYNGIVEAIKITEKIEDFGKIARKHKSFARFKTFIEQLQDT
ncbi:MAG: hypothetical protein LBF88_07545 [Planctomycetaceae bacterium]|jgi:hypothetical protein|nr:hypothetical protein [Planctomycetaceae bacterium]